MKKILLSIVIAIFTLSLSAQHEEIISIIKTANEKTTSLSGQFTRTKHLILLKKEIIGEGELFFKDNKLAMFYSKPKDESFIINGDYAYMILLGKQNKTNIKKNNQFKELSEILLYSMNGDINNILKSNVGTIDYNFDDNNHIFTLVKIDKPKKGYYKLIVKYNKKDLTINELSMYEIDENYVVYTINDKTLNNSIDETVFIPKGK